ncbi:hypothetical protein JVT61DRAFT_7894 [Boletus reticuloceps]|uniref:Uncharacterized protein n=1 Tax=Boletus reticuloceps TaxID=495285 RepID=A0A8I2YI03_9AGAM|nr:hypothetical protein JVT61DRAFT_7894 [Boletus reticuloceps]
MCIYSLNRPFPSARSISVLPTPSAGSAETLTPKCNAILRVYTRAVFPQGPASLDGRLG